MCTDMEYLPQLLIVVENDILLNTNRRNSWNSSAPRLPSTNMRSTTNTIISPDPDTTSWLGKSLLAPFKRLFHRNINSSRSISAVSSRRSSADVEETRKTEISEIETPPNNGKETENPIVPPSPEIVIQENVIENQTNSIDPLYDYNTLLSRCLERQSHDRNEMISRCQRPVTIPRSDLIVGHSRSKLVNWKSYVRLCRLLKRDPNLFQQYINQYYSCHSSVNQREQLIFNVQTTRTIFDNLLKTFLDEYVTCLACQKAQTHLIKSAGLWRVDCQLCGSQRSVKRLKWKRSNNDEKRIFN